MEVAAQGGEGIKKAAYILQAAGCHLFNIFCFSVSLRRQKKSLHTFM